jgi:hypothetical protein
LISLAHLLYGEWLRRERPRIERARRELTATGETARKRRGAIGDQELTALRKVFTKLGIESRTQLDRVLPD